MQNLKFQVRAQTEAGEAERQPGTLSQAVSPNSFQQPQKRQIGTQRPTGKAISSKSWQVWMVPQNAAGWTHVVRYAYL